ncbi:MAG: cysteine hydrolase family protein [Alphaproteobacteria bacterium]
MAAAASGGLRQEIAAAGAVHLCVDMQRMFAEPTPWRTPWMARVAPVVESVAARHAARTIFTRFIPPIRADDMPGRWRDYYRRWPEMTRERLDPALLELMSPLSAFAPPARVWNKAVYSPFATPHLHRLLRQESVRTLAITGGETDMCVLATVLGAVDLGYRVVLVEDGLCSASDDSHDAMMRLYRERFSQQIEVCSSGELLDAWRA